MAKQIDQLNSDHNQQEVKDDLRHLINNVASLSHLRDQPDILYKEILANISGIDLISIIKSEFMSQDIDVLRAHPSYDLIQQAMLDFFGYHQTQIDSDLGSGTDAGVRALQQDYNTLFSPQPLLVVDGDPGPLFFKAWMQMESDGFDPHTQEFYPSTPATTPSSPAIVPNAPIRTTAVETVYDSQLLDPNDPRLADHNYGEGMCSKNTRLALAQLTDGVIPGHHVTYGSKMSNGLRTNSAKDIYLDGLQNRRIETVTSDRNDTASIHQYFKDRKNNGNGTIFDIYVNTDAGHRCYGFWDKNGTMWIKDESHGGQMTLDEYISRVGQNKYTGRNLMVSKRVYYPKGSNRVVESEPVIAEPKRVVINSIKSQNTISILGMTASDYVDKVALEHPTFAASIKKYGLTIIKEASKYPRLKDHIPLIFAQVEQESSRKDYALNNKGELSYGLFQVNKKAGHPLSKSGFGSDIFTNPEQNIAYGIRYLDECTRQKGGNIRDGLDRYNGGKNFSKLVEDRYSTKIYGIVGTYSSYSNADIA